MLAVTVPDNSWLSCRIGPRWPDTWPAKPRCAPPPIGGRDAFAHPTPPASPHQSGGCALDIHRQEQPDAQWDYRTPYPDTGFCGDSAVGSGRSTTMASRVAAKSLVSWTLAPATITLKGPPAASTSRLCLLPALPRSVGLRPIRSPQNGLSPRRCRRTAIPSPPRPTRHHGTG